MPFNLLLIPLLGGYIFVRFWNYSKIHILRADKDRILIRASLVGFFSLIPAFLLSIFVPQILPCKSETICLYSWWAQNIPFEYLGVSMIAFSLASTIWYPLNIWCTDEKAVDKAIAEDADPMEITLKASKDFGLPLAITLQDGKVYIGVVTHQFNPATPTNNIAIFPLQSGYREPESKRLRLRINYAVIAKRMRDRLDILSNQIAKIQDLLKTHPRIEDPDVAVKLTQMLDRRSAKWEALEIKIDMFEVLLPVSQITSVFYFDEGTYKDFFLKYKSEMLPGKVGS